MQHALNPKRRPARTRAISSVGAATLALVLCGFAWREWTRPPTNATEAGRGLLHALQANDVAGVRASLWPQETKTLGMSEAQVDAVLREVICPAYQRLRLDPANVRQTGGGEDWYAVIPASPPEGPTLVYLWFQQMEPERYTTTLTNLVLGLMKVEREAARKSGREAERKLLSGQRDMKLERLGMPGMCDARDLSIRPWSHRR